MAIIADNTNIKKKRRGKNIVQQKRWKRRSREDQKQWTKWGNESDRKIKVDELKSAIQDQSYINSAIDSLAERIACQWIKEKYGSGANKCL